MRLHVHRWGRGPRVVLIHGGVLGGREAWRAQRPLSERWTLLAPDRPGHGQSPDARQDFEVDAHLIAAQLLSEPAHLVGYSYGAIVAMLAAVEQPQQVWSLTVVEPPAMRVAKGVPIVDDWERKARQAFRDRRDGDLRSAVDEFFEMAGVPVPVPNPLPAPIERGTRALMGARPPGDAEIPVNDLRAGPFPILVISGGHMEEYEIVCDEIARQTGAARKILTGNAHLVPDLGPPFNGVVEAFWKAAGR